MDLKLALLVAAGGALGSAARYLINVAALRLFGADFPWGTFIANVAGCFLMGLLAGTALYRLDISSEARAFLATGVLGGFTTFSAFALDGFLLYERNAGLAAIYVGASVLLSLTTLLAGLSIARLLP